MVYNNGTNNENNGYINMQNSINYSYSQSSMTNEQYREEQIYLYVLRCCLYPLENETTDLNCNEKITLKFKNYIYSKKMNINVKYPKYATTENINKLGQCIFNICIQEFYKLFQTSGMFKDYLLFYIHLVNIQMKMLKIKFSLNDDSYDKTILDSMSLFINFFIEFLNKNYPEIDIQDYEIFQSSKYISLISNHLKGKSYVLNESGNLSDWAKIIFEVDTNKHNLTISNIKKSINKKTSNIKTLLDFKKYLDLIEINAYPYSLNTDFYSNELYEIWKKTEKALVVKEITSLQNSLSSENKNIYMANQKDDFYFIPPDPYSAFKKVIELCMYQDCSDSSNNSSEILSNNSKNIINECEIRWRISSVYKEIIILEILVQNFINNYISIEDIYDICESYIESISQKGSLRVKETNYFCQILNELSEKIMNDISHIFQIVENVSQIQPYLTNVVNVMKFINENKIYQANKLRNNNRINYIKEIQEKLKIAIKVYYSNMEQSIFSSTEDEMTKTMKYFGSLKSFIDDFQIVIQISRNSVLSLVSILSEVSYLSTLKYLPKPELIENIEDNFNDLFEIYKLSKFLYEKSRVKRTFEDVENWFKIFVEKWIMSTDENITKRIESIIKFEKYEPINLDQKIYYSDSVIDLYRHFDLVMSSMKQIEWSEITDKAIFMKKYIKIINRLIKEYIHRMDFDCDMIMSDCVDVDELLKLVDKKSEEIRASQSFQDAVDTFNPKKYIKLNNIFETYSQLNNLCSNSDIPYFHKILDAQPYDKNTLSQKQTVTNEIEYYRIKVVNIKGLDSINSGLLSTYVTIMLNDRKVYKSRVKERSVNPEFNELFTLRLQDTEPSVLNIQIKNKNSEIKNTVIGETKVMIRSILFEDGLTHNVEIPINSSCVLTMRVCKQKEIDDIKYWTLNISEKLEFLIEDSCRTIVYTISSTVINYINKIIESNKSYEILETEHQMIPLFEYLNKSLLDINTYLDIKINKYLAEHFDEPFLKKYLPKPKITIKTDNLGGKTVSNMKLKREFTRAQTLINRVKNNDKDTKGGLKIGRTRRRINGGLNFSNDSNESDKINDDDDDDEMMNDDENGNMPSHDFIKLIWKGVLDELYSLILQNYDQFGNLVKEKSKGKGRFFNNFQQLLGTGFNKKSIEIVNNSLELLKSFFACEIDNTCYGFTKEELETENYKKLKNLIKLCKENRN